jgi:hypothetical protein
MLGKLFTTELHPQPQYYHFLRELDLPVNVICLSFSICVYTDVYSCEYSGQGGVQSSIQILLLCCSVGGTLSASKVSAAIRGRREDVTLNFVQKC